MFNRVFLVVLDSLGIGPTKDQDKFGDKGANTLKHTIGDKYNLDVLELLNILEQKFGQDIILLCHENIEEFCHRRLIADYIELQTGIYIPEVSITEKGKVKKLLPIRYKNRLNEFINK